MEEGLGVPLEGVQVVWFKRDLRVRDHAPLLQACQRGPIICLYIYEPSWLLAPDFDPMHLRFINQSLAELEVELARRGGQLLLRVGEVVEVLEGLHRKVPFGALWSHEETGNWLSFMRDRAVERWAQERGVVWHQSPCNAVVRRLKNRDLWAGIWQRRMGPKPLRPPDWIHRVPGLAAEGIRSPLELGLDSAGVRPEAVMGGERAGWAALESFLEVRGVNYRADMASPVQGWRSCSRISPHLTWGNLSIRQVHHRLGQQFEVLRRAPAPSVDPRWKNSLTSFRSRLFWHCHFIQKLEDEPELEFRNMNPGFDGMRDHEHLDRTRFEAWCAGQTGYPLVDACMRALHAGGWINFRMRAMLVSFASYHLWLHWVEPARYLARQFLDYEPGIHYTQFQMQSGVTGINTLRIYSPRKQAREQDPTGEFIKRYVPELAGVPTEHLAEPHKMPPLLQHSAGCVVGRDYPAPIVDHEVAYKAAKDAAFGWKKRPEVQKAAKIVYARHGSRKRRRNQRSHFGNG